MRRWRGRLGGLLAVLGAAAALLAACGGDDTGDGESFPEGEHAADADAKSLVRLAQTALEVHAVDNDGSYTGADLQALVTIEPTLEGADLDLQASKDGYAVSTTSSSGALFALVREADGSSTYSCEPPGEVAGCPASGDWSTD